MEEEIAKDKNKKIKKEILEWLVCLLIAIVIYLVINYFFGTVSGIKQTSMTPTFCEGEKILIKRPVIFKEELKYGDVITFIQPNEENVRFNTNPKNITGELIVEQDAIAKYDKRNGLSAFMYYFIGIGKNSYIKRVIGLPGDHIEIKEDGTVLRNDFILDELYLKDGTTSQNGRYINIIVPEDAVFVMGDNRLESLDSRALGCIPYSKIDGYVIGKIWPFNKFEIYD